MSGSTRQIETVVVIVGALVCAAIIGRLVQVAYMRSLEGTSSEEEHGAVDAPYRATVLARLQEQRWLNGLGYTRDLKQLASGATAPMRTPGVEVRATPTSFTITAHSRDEPGVWYRLRVDRRARRVTATCGGDPTEFCVDGRWAIERFATSERQLLGR